MKNKLLRGTMVLLCSSLVLRCLGFVYQMLVVRYTGTEALGILNMTMPFYMLFVVLATMGFPVAISKLIAEAVSCNRQDNVSQMMRTAFLFVGLLAVFCAALAYYFMPFVFSLLHTEERVRQCFCVLIPGIVLVPLCSVMRGYFQGMQQMIYPAMSQIFEQLIRVICGIVLIIFISPQDVLSFAMSLAIAAMIGEFSGCLFLWFCYRYSRKRQCNAKQKNKSTWEVKWLNPLLSLGIPVTGTRLTSTIDMAIEASMVPSCLIAIGYNSSQAASIYGQFSGVAISLLIIPTVLTSALGTALIPAISSAASNQEKTMLQQYCQQAISVTWIFSLPIIFILYLYGEELGKLLFHIDGLGAMMRWLSFGAIFLYLGQTVVGILQGLGSTRTVFQNNFFGSAAKLIGMYYCIKILGLGANGIAGGMILGYGLQCLLNIAALNLRVSICLPWKDVFLPILNSVMMVVHLQFWENLMPEENMIFLLVRLIFAAIGYLIIMMITGQMKRVLK